MNRFRFTITSSAIALVGLIGGTAALIHADSDANTDPIIGEQVIDICIEDKGAPVFMPFSRGHCRMAGADG